MDIYLRKEYLEAIFDIFVENNDIELDDTYLTASMLSIFTDGSKRQIGTQIDGGILGNKAYHIDKLSDENIKGYREGLYECLNWLILDKIVTKIDIITEKKGNTLNVSITFTTDDENQDNLKYSLDEKMSILDPDFVEAKESTNLYPANDLYPSDNLYPGSSLYPEIEPIQFISYDFNLETV